MRKHCKREHYQVLGVDTIRTAIEGAAITDDSRLLRLQIAESNALNLMVKGEGGVAQWRDLCDVVNIAETMASKGVGVEAMPCIQVAHQALLEAARRYEKTKKMGLSAKGIEALRDVFEYHHLQRTSITRSEYEGFIDLTARRIRSNHKDVVTV